MTAVRGGRAGFAREELADSLGSAYLRDMTRRNANGRKPAKRDLPSKTCAACGRPFVWRRKWARDWEQVKYCSDRCRAAART